MNPAVNKLETLLARIAKNRAAPRVTAPRVAPTDTKPQAVSATPVPAPAAPARAATPIPAPAAPSSERAASPRPPSTPPAPVASATPVPAPSSPSKLPSSDGDDLIVSTPVASSAAPISPNVEKAPAPAPATDAPKRVEAKTVELELDALPELSSRDSEPELEIVETKNESADERQLSPFDDEPEIFEVATSDDPVVVLDDETSDAEIIEPAKPAQARVEAASVSDIEITIAPEPAKAEAPKAEPAKAEPAKPAPAAASFDEASFADVDIDAPAPPPPAAKVEKVTPLEAAVRAVESPNVIEPSDIVAKASADVVRVVAPAKAVAPETFSSLIKRSLGLRLR